MIEGLSEIVDKWGPMALKTLDVAIVYYILYRVLLLIKGTRAVQMLIGLLAIIIAYFASKPDFLGLSTLHWLLDTFLSSFFLIIIVIFQDDIRRMLSHVGQTSLFSGLTSRLASTQIIEEIVKASNQLAETQTGALIAIQRDADLSEYTESGTLLDATISKTLLASIFIKSNPMHDGAVIVHNDRIIAAGCVLRLSENQDIPQQLGTRHRAAIGLSEETDAPIVVVSEETGIISVAFKGEMVRELDATKLRELLQRILAEKTDTDENAQRKGFGNRLQSLLRRQPHSNEPPTPVSDAKEVGKS